ncbi:MAG: phage virion morphogenesis protein [Rhodobacteraceae bacterium]|nr:phage virion morphogenesis protein [Paracoccaceae bacterium]
MAGAGIRIETNAAAASADLARRIARMSDTRPVMDEIGSLLEESTRERFDRERGPDGAPWLPSLRARREGGKTLTDSARLRESITRRVTGSGSRAEVEVGTNVIYAAIHQFGGEIRRAARRQTLAFNAAGNRFASRRSTSRRRAGIVRIAIADIGEGTSVMPARPFLGVSAADRAGIERIVVNHLVRAGL